MSLTGGELNFLNGKFGIRPASFGNVREGIIYLF